MNADDFKTEEEFDLYVKGAWDERARIIELMEHQEVWNSLDNKWVHPTYCLTCRNIERIQGKPSDD